MKILSLEMELPSALEVMTITIFVLVFFLSVSVKLSVVCGTFSTFVADETWNCTSRTAGWSKCHSFSVTLGTASTPTRSWYSVCFLACLTETFTVCGYQSSGKSHKELDGRICFLWEPSCKCTSKGTRWAFVRLSVLAVWYKVTL